MRCSPAEERIKMAELAEVFAWFTLIVFLCAVNVATVCVATLVVKLVIEWWKEFKEDG